MTVDVVTLTLNPALDTTAEVEALVPYRKLRAGLATYEPGGGGINVARVLHRFGVATTAVFPAGGLTGATLIAELAREGVRMEAVSSRAATRQSITLWARSSGEHYRILVDGDPLSTSELRSCIELLGREAPRFVVLSGSLPPGVAPTVVRDVAEVARSRGAAFVCDTSGAALTVAAEAGAGLVKPSRRELHEVLGGGAPLGDFDHERAARGLVARGARAVLVSLGADGAFLATADGDAIRYAAPEIRAVSTVGAGDSLVAGTLVALVRGCELVDAVHLGLATAAASCRKHGSQLADLADVPGAFAVAREAARGSNDHAVVAN